MKKMLALISLAIALSGCATQGYVGLVQFNHPEPSSGIWGYNKSEARFFHWQKPYRDEALDGIKNYCHGDYDIYKEEDLPGVSNAYGKGGIRRLYFNCKPTQSAKNR